MSRIQERTIDKSAHMCFDCGNRGHWKGDAECPGRKAGIRTREENHNMQAAIKCLTCGQSGHSQLHCGARRVKCHACEEDHYAGPATCRYGKCTAVYLMRILMIMVKSLHPGALPTRAWLTEVFKHQGLKHPWTAEDNVTAAAATAVPMRMIPAGFVTSTNTA